MIVEMNTQPVLPRGPIYPRFQAATPPVMAAAVDAANATSAGVFSFWVGAAYTFLITSRSVEFIDTTGRLHLSILSGFFCILALLMSGNIPRLLITKPGKRITLLCFWILIGLPFSMWKGGSVEIFTSVWIKSYITFFIVGGLLFSLKQLRKMIVILAMGTFCQVYLAYRGGVVESDRLSMTYGTLGNSNDLATALLLGLPFILFVLFDKTSNLFLRLICIPLVVLLLISVLKTGSRGGLVAIVVLIAFVFFKSSMGNKIKIAAACILFVALFAAVVPSGLRARYMTIFSSSSSDADGAVNSALESSTARRELLKNGLLLTLKHPVFGVGLGQFSPQSFNLLIARGLQGMWFTSHDVYILVSAEIGIPGLWFYCALILAAFQPMWRLAKLPHSTPELTIIARLAYSIMMSMLGYCVCGIFSTQAFSAQLPVLAALSAALVRVSEPYIDAAGAAPVPLAVAPQPFVNRRLKQTPVSAAL